MKKQAMITLPLLAMAASAQACFIFDCQHVELSSREYKLPNNYYILEPSDAYRLDDEPKTYGLYAAGSPDQATPLAEFQLTDMHTACCLQDAAIGEPWVARTEVKLSMNGQEKILCVYRPGANFLNSWQFDLQAVLQDSTFSVTASIPSTAGTCDFAGGQFVGEGTQDGVYSVSLSTPIAK